MSTNHVSIPSDYGPDDPRLHLLRAEDGDICVTVHPGDRLPCTNAFIASTSGSRDPTVTMILILLFAYKSGNASWAADLAASIAHDLRVTVNEASDV